MTGTFSHFTARILRAVCILGTALPLWSTHAADTNINAAAKTPAIPSATATPATPKPAPKPLTKPLWTELTPAQQQALGPLVAEWDRLEPVRKKKWLEIAQKYPTMKPDEQVRLQTRMREWAKLTPEQRRIARESYARARALNADQKSAQWQQYQQLSEEQKKKLANDAKSKKQVANLPSAKSKDKIVAPIKSSQKPLPAPKPPVSASTSAPTPVPASVPSTPTGPVVPDASVPQSSQPGTPSNSAPAATPVQPHAKQ
jgi:hypothetical protein